MKKTEVTRSHVTLSQVPRSAARNTALPWAAAVVASLILGTLCGCSSSSAVAPIVGSQRAKAGSVVQADAVADAKVTFGEYRAGFHRYQRCMKKAGWEVYFSDDSGYLINYAFPAAGEKDDAICYAREFGALDDAWQAENVDRDDNTVRYKTCLLNAGITPGSTRAEIDAQLAAAGISPQSCDGH